MDALAYSPTLLWESKNYRAIYQNDDATSTIDTPMFSNMDGSGSLYLSSNSDLNGVCALYGLGTAVPSGALFSNAGNYDRNVVVNSESTFQRFESNANYKVISRLNCESRVARPVPVSSRYGAILKNDDGSFTVKSPRFLMNNTVMGLSANSDPTGVCRLYGLKTPVPNSVIIGNAGNNDRNAVIGVDSKFSRYQNNADYQVIVSLACRS